MEAQDRFPIVFSSGFPSAGPNRSFQPRQAREVEGAAAACITGSGGVELRRSLHRKPLKDI